MKKISLLLALVLLIGVLSAALCLTASAAADAPAAISETEAAAETDAPADGSLSPETGDFTLASIALVITAAIGIILFFKKRKDTDL